MKKEINSLYLVYNIFSLAKMAGKPFSWRQAEYELAIEKTCYYEWCYIKHLLVFRLWIIISSQERTPRQALSVQSQQQKHLAVKKPERLSIVSIANFDHILYLFLAFLLLTLNK